MNNSFETLLFEVGENGVAVVTINRPKQLNALNNQVFEELDSALGIIEKETHIKGVIITGAGDKAFVAGADIKEFASFSALQAQELSTRGHRVFQRLADLTKPVIAAVNGFALGGGCELAMACHLRIASSNAKMGLPEVSLGLIPGYGGTQRLPELVGKAKAMELTLSGTFIDAHEAERIGLINGVADESALEDAQKIMRAMIKQGPLALKNVILAINESGTESGFQTEASLFGALFETEDFKEGTSAFMEKRKPTFSGK